MDTRSGTPDSISAVVHLPAINVEILVSKTIKALASHYRTVEDERIKKDRPSDRSVRIYS